MSGTNVHGLKDVRTIKVRLYNTYIVQEPESGYEEQRKKERKKKFSEKKKINKKKIKK